jgi:hypothetical protein
MLTPVGSNLCKYNAISTEATLKAIQRDTPKSSTA